MTIPGRLAADGVSANLVDLGGRFADLLAYEFKTNTIQLNVIQDKLIVYAKQLNMSAGDADTFMTIENINISLHKSSGLLANMTKEQLYKASVTSGLKNMSWAEFSGPAICTSSTNYKKNIGLKVREDIVVLEHMLHLTLKLMTGIALQTSS